MKKKILIGFAIILAITLVGYCLLLTYFTYRTVWNYDKGADAYTAGDYAEAERRFRAASTYDSSEAPFRLGMMYLKGVGVTADKRAAVVWFRRAANSGSAKAQIKLGWMYEQGDGVHKNIDEAIRLYQLAVDQQYAVAAFILASHYETGTGVERNDVEAVRLYRLAADHDQYLAMDRLAWLLATHEDQNIRNPTEALYFAEALVSGSKAFINHYAGKINPAADTDIGLKLLAATSMGRDSLAAAYAADGRFDDAIREQLLAIQRKIAAGFSFDIDEVRLSLFRQHKALYCPGGPGC